MFVSSTRSVIVSLNALGLSEPEIARRLSLAPTTVRYHLARPESPRRVQADGSAPGPSVAAAAVETVPTRQRVAALLASGSSRAETARQLGLSKSTVSYHARRLGKPVDERCARRYDWTAIQRHYDAGHSVRTCQAAFGFSSGAWFDAVRRGAVVARGAATPISELLVAGTYRGRHNLKLRLISGGLKASRCERCGIESWQGHPLTLALHHVNGQRDDNRLENLELLCPNCHSQTENFAGRNRRGREPAANADAAPGFAVGREPQDRQR